jgi:competence protein ComEC
MFTWIPYAFVRIVVFYIAGILLGIYFPDSIPLLYAIIAFLAAITIYFLLVWRYYKKDKSINPGMVGLCAVFVAGFVNVDFHDLKSRTGHLIHEKNVVTEYVAVVNGAPQNKAKTWKVPVELREIRTNSKWARATGRILLYLPHDDFQQPPLYGDVLLIQGTPQLVTGPSNPGEFNYQEFLAFQGIYHQHFIKDKNLVAIDHDPSNILMARAIEARLWAEEKLMQYVTGTREQGIAIALVLGVTDGLDRELIGAYGATGTLHVLAVSGLHISIIYMIIAWLLTPWSKSTRGKWTVAVISLVLLWSYAFITGLSPSVLRAVTMFTFVALAKPWKQTINIYNTLAASAFLLLVFDPFMIMSVGFQLSYLAVLGIVYLQPKLYEMFDPSNRVVDEIWKVTSVSIAAQVATLPLGLLFFHQFPNYFVISNLLVIPASFVVLIAGILVLAMNWFSLVAQGIGWMLTWVIKIMNMIVFAIDGLPGSLTDNIFITPLQASLLAVLIVFMLLLFEQKKFIYLTLAFATALAFGWSRWMFQNNAVQSARISIYNVAHHTAIDLSENGQSFFLKDSLLISDHRKIDFHVKPGRLLHGIKNILHQENIREVDGGRIFFWNGKYFLWIDHRPQQVYPSLAVDYVIVSNNAIRSLDVLSNVKRVHTIVDSSNSFYLAKQLKSEAEGKGFSIFAVPVQGSYQEKINL